MRDNNQLLAEKIYNIENADYEQIQEWYHNNINKWSLTDNIYLERSDDCMCWYLWKSNDYGEYGFVKILPRLYYSKKDIEKMLGVQKWIWL